MRTTLMQAFPPCVSFIRRVIQALAVHTSRFACRVGIELATVEVRCEHLTLEAEIQLGKRALPTVLNAYRDFFEVSTC